MIEAVVLGQTRFHVPGLAADERGVAVGRRLLCLFTDRPHLLGFLRSLSRAGALKDILSSVLMEELATLQGGRDVAVSFDVASSYGAEPCAAAARAHQALVLTGNQRQFVPYRDARRPLGCDVADATVLKNAEGAYAFFLDGGAELRPILARLDLKDLLIRMLPVPLRPKEVSEQRPEAVVLRVPRGLLPSVRSYLWRRRVDADVSMVRLQSHSLFERDAGELGLVRCRDLPAGALALMESTPGLEVYLPTLDHLLVQRGFRHPIALDACASMFPSDEVLLFCGTRKCVEHLTEPLQAVALDDVMDVALALEDGTQVIRAEPAQLGAVEHLKVDVRLVQDEDARVSAEAILVPNARLGDLLALVHVLPQTLWIGCLVALARPYTVVLCPQGVRAFPLGHALAQVHARVFVPAGMRFSPRLTDEIMAEHFLLAGNDHMVFFPPPDAGDPFIVGRSAFVPLSRAAIHPEDLSSVLAAVELMPGLDLVSEPVIHHPPPSEFSRWDGLASGAAAGERVTRPRPAEKEPPADQRLPAPWSHKE
jgi:hypothetical protein